MPVDIILPPVVDTKNTIDDINTRRWYTFTYKDKDAKIELEGVAMLKYMYASDTHTLITIDQDNHLDIWSDIHVYSGRYNFEFGTDPLPANTKFVVTIKD